MSFSSTYDAARQSQCGREVMLFARGIERKKEISEKRKAEIKDWRGATAHIKNWASLHPAPPPIPHPQIICPKENKLNPVVNYRLRPGSGGCRVLHTSAAAAASSVASPRCLMKSNIKHLSTLWMTGFKRDCMNMSRSARQCASSVRLLLDGRLCRDALRIAVTFHVSYSWKMVQTHDRRRSEPPSLSIFCSFFF